MSEWGQRLSLIACLSSSVRRCYKLGKPVNVEVCIQQILQGVYCPVKNLLPRVMDMGRFRSIRALGVELGFLYELTDLFVDDYLFKAKRQHTEDPQMAVDVYNDAPWWADCMPPRGADDARFIRICVGEASLNWMMQSFLLFHTYCELRCMLDEYSLERESSLQKTAELFQEELNRRFSHVLSQSEVEGLRSIFWYTSTVWAILLDDVYVSEEYKDHCGLKDRRSLLWHLCSFGLPTLRQFLELPPAERNDSRSFSFPFAYLES